MNSFAVLVVALVHALAGAQLAPSAPRAPGNDEGWVDELVFLDSDSVVLLCFDGTARVSNDRGRTWVSHAFPTYSCDATVDPRGTIWSLYTWRGMDPEPELVRSSDGGRTWSSIEYPSPERALPIDFVSVDRDEPVLLDQRGQCWGHRPGAQESLESWTKLGAPNPDHDGESGLARGNWIYVASDTDVWKSADGGVSWTSTGWLAGVVAFTLVPAVKTDEAERIAAATRDGTVYVVELGKQSWKKLGRMENGAQIFDLVASREGIWACGRIGRRALGGYVDWNGTWSALEGVHDQPTSGIRRAADGRVWIAGHGVYVADARARRWERVWPR